MIDTRDHTIAPPLMTQLHWPSAVPTSYFPQTVAYLAVGFTNRQRHWVNREVEIARRLYLDAHATLAPL
jgi:hypothetical protein